VIVRIDFPVILYTKKYILGGIKSENTLNIVGYKNYLKGCYDGAIIIDSSGKRLAVTKVSEDVNNKYYSIWNFIAQYRKVRVKLELSKPVFSTLAEAREEILSLIIKNRWYGSSDDTEESVKKYLEEASTFEELINKISVYP